MGSQRLPGLDLLRATGIILVMFYHASLCGLVSPSFPLARFGWMGVDIFFALSGFLIGSQLFKLARKEGRTPFDYAAEVFGEKVFSTQLSYAHPVTLMDVDQDESADRATNTRSGLRTDRS